MNKFSYARDDIVANFVAESRKYPLITAEQERELTNRWREDGDKAALTLLLGSHLRLVIKIAHSDVGYGLPLADLIAEGNVGLMQAAERFDPDRGFRFATFAQWWIRAAIRDYILRSWSMVRMGTTAAQKKLFFNLRRLKSSLNAYDEGDLSPEVVATISAELDVSDREVIEMNRRLAGSESSLNARVGDDGDTSHQDLLEDESPDQETRYADAEEFDKRWALIEKELEELTPRERHILTERKLSDIPKTLEALSEIHGVSRERIRQIEVAALKKLKNAVYMAARPQGLLGQSDHDTSALMTAA